MFKDNFITELKGSVSIIDVVSKNVKLKKRGREYIGLSPFSNEKTPSFTVNPEKQFYHCFSTGRNGDIISFVMELNNLSFIPAIEKICNDYNINIPELEDQGNDYNKNITLHRRLKSCLREALLFFKVQLRESDAAKKYIITRRLDTQDIIDFSLGYAPDDFNLIIEFLKSKGYSNDEMVTCGLAIKSNKSDKYWSKFRDRIMFPVFNDIGEVVAFGGRTLKSSGEAKYINSPETPVFKKREVLYNMQNARAHLSQRKCSNITVVEGYLDVIMLQKNNIYGCVSSMGTALTDSQVKNIWRIDQSPVICFDGDKAGRLACKRSATKNILHLSPKKSLRFCMMKDGLDPFDYTVRHGPEKMIDKLNSSIGTVEALWEFEKEKYFPIDTPEKKAGIRQDMFDHISRITHKDLSYQFKQQFYHLFSRDIPNYWDHRKSRPVNSIGTVTGESFIEKILIGAIYYQPLIAYKIKDKIKLIETTILECENIKQIVIDCIESQEYSNIEECILSNISDLEINFMKENRNVIFASFLNFDITESEILEIWNFNFEKI